MGEEKMRKKKKKKKKKPGRDPSVIWNETPPEKLQFQHSGIPAVRYKMIIDDNDYLNKSMVVGETNSYIFIVEVRSKKEN